MGLDRIVMMQTVCRDVRSYLRSRNCDSIRPTLMRLEREERYGVFYLTFNELDEDFNVPNLDVIYKKRVLEDRRILGVIRGEIATFERELRRIDELVGYPQYQAFCVLHKKDPKTYHEWLEDTVGPGELDSR